MELGLDKLLISNTYETSKKRIWFRINRLALIARKWRLNKPGAITRPRSKRLRKLALYSTNGSSGEREMGEAEGETGDGSAPSE